MLLLASEPTSWPDVVLAVAMFAFFGFVIWACTR
jgi:nitrate reductase NapE component